MHRRQFLQWLALLGMAPSLSACESQQSGERMRPRFWDPPHDTVIPPSDDDEDDEVMRALIDVLVPAEYDDGGAMTSPGALETGALEVLALRSFLPAARGLGFVRALPSELDAAFELGAPAFDRALRAIVRHDLDALADDLAPGARFTALDPAEQRSVIAEAFRDPLKSAALLYVRAASFVAYLGAVRSDQGLVAVGFPPFEDFDGRIAVSGYPRTISGRLVDANREDLDALRARGELDDYTYARRPEPTPDDDLMDVLDASGDLF